MMAREVNPHPFDIVSQALNCPRESLSMNSAMYRDHGWDSIGHMNVIVALEEAYGVQIKDDELEMYSTMEAIYRLYQQVALRDQPNGA